MESFSRCAVTKKREKILDRDKEDRKISGAELLDANLRRDIVTSILKSSRNEASPVLHCALSFPPPRLAMLRIINARLQSGFTSGESVAPFSGHFSAVSFAHVARYEEGRKAKRLLFPSFVVLVSSISRSPICPIAT